MPHAAGPEALVDRRDHVVVLRLVTGLGGRLLYGEVVDVDGVHRSPFVGWRGLTVSVRKWLASAAAREPRQDRPAAIDVSGDEPTH